MNTSLRSADWYLSLVEDCAAIITEKSFESRWSLLEGYHQLGERLREDGDKAKMSELVSFVSKDLQVSERTVYYAVAFFDQYPELEAIPNGKAASWTQIKKLLPGGEKSKPNFQADVLAKRLFARHGKENVVSLIASLSKLLESM